jgi:hypothetical protein
MERRQFLKNFGLGSLFSISSLAGMRKTSAGEKDFLKDTSSENLSQRPFSILQSAASTSATTLVAVVPRRALVTFEIVECESDYRPPFLLKEMSMFENLLPDSERVFHIHVEELREGRDYKLLCYENSELRDLRYFSGLKLDHKKFAALSCSNQSLVGPQKGIWSSLKSENVDALFYLGDSVYANSPWDTVLGKLARPEKAYERYLQAFKTIPLYRFDKLIPVFNVWDDHDYASNNGDKYHPHKIEMQSIFRVFFPLDYGPHLEKGPGVSFSITFGNCIYYFIDGRSFRDYSTETNSLLGDQQKEWLSGRLKQNPVPSVLILGSQIYGFGRNRDCVEARHPADLFWLQKLFRHFNAPMAFITGDVHFSHVQKLSAEDFGYSTYEFTSSAMHSYYFPGWGRRSPLLGQMHYCGWPNYNVFEISSLSGQMKVQFLCKASDNSVQYQSEVLIVPPPERL